MFPQEFVISFPSKVEIDAVKMTCSNGKLNKKYEVREQAKGQYKFLKTFFLTVTNAETVPSTPINFPMFLADHIAFDQ